MNITHIITRLILGGAQENTLLTCRGLQQRGHDVTLITGPPIGPEGQLIDRAAKAPYRLIVLPQLRRAINPIRDLIAYSQLKDHLDRLAPDIVHTHSAKAGILGRRAAAHLQARTAPSCCGPLRALQQAQQSHCCPVPRPQVVHTVHGLPFHAYESGLKNRLYIALERRAAEQTDAFITVADAMTRQSLAAGIGRDEDYTTVYSGMELAPFLTPPDRQTIAEIRAGWNAGPDTVVIATVARLFELKGHEYIIKAAETLARRHPNAHWVFIGDGNLRGWVERTLAGKQLTNRFHLTGLVPPERIPALLYASDMLLHCSLREGLPRAIPQALLCQRPAIAFDLDGAPEVVLDGRTGFLVPPESVEQLIEAQSRLITAPTLREEMGRNGRELCRNRFDHHTMVDGILAVYQRLLSPQAKKPAKKA